MDPLHPMSFWLLVASVLTHQLRAQNAYLLRVALSTRLMGILHIHLMIYSPECSIHQSTIVYPILFLQNPND